MPRPCASNKCTADSCGRSQAAGVAAFIFYLHSLAARCKVLLMQGQLSFSTYEIARVELPKPGDTTWRKGERCIVLDSQEMAHGIMIRVIFPSDGREGIYKPSELGLAAADMAKMGAKP